MVCRRGMVFLSQRGSVVYLGEVEMLGDADEECGSLWVCLMGGDGVRQAARHKSLECQDKFGFG